MNKDQYVEVIMIDLSYNDTVVDLNVVVENSLAVVIGLSEVQFRE